MRLRSHGIYPDSYAPGTLREKLHGRGDRLPDEHRGARYRVWAGVAAGA
ncbi:hypothetical protein [Microbacterium sp. NPDC077184]